MIEYIRRLIEGEDLSRTQMHDAMTSILEGHATEAQIAAFAVALRMKGETAEEIAAAAAVMREQCAAVGLGTDEPVVDTCGTGGDGLHTFNVSTVAAIVVASCGVRVAKHGNRAVSSKSGSADVLEALGVRIDLKPEAVRRCVGDVGIGFLFAPTHHQAMRHAAPVRKQIGIRTFFNLLGPLSNPASATHQLLGVYDPKRVEPIAHALHQLGVEGAWVVHGEGGMDEVSPVGPTRVAMLGPDGEVETRTLTPSDFGLSPIALDTLRGGDATQNAVIAKEILEGRGGDKANAVVINAASALCVAGRAASPLEGAKLAQHAIADGRASKLLSRWVTVTKRLGEAS